MCVCVCLYVCVRERKRQTDRQTDRQIDREIVVKEALSPHNEVTSHGQKLINSLFKLDLQHSMFFFGIENNVSLTLL